jgi:RES domain-containing protein
LLDVPDPPVRAGRYHRLNGRPTWYGSTSEAGAWAEFARSLPDGVDPAQFKRHVGRVDFDVMVLDLTDSDVQTRLGISRGDLIADDDAVCQALADLAANAGFEAVLGPSAALPDDATLAVFGDAIRARSRDVVDRGVRSAPTGQSGPIRRRRR